MSSSDMNGMKELDHQDIWFWVQVLERNLSLWEKSTIIDMSREYCRHYHKGCKAENRYAPLPYTPTEQSEKIQELLNTEANNALKAFLEEQ